MNLSYAPMLEAAKALLLQRRQETIAMLESCGVDPRTVPLWPDIWREGPVVYVDRYMYDERSIPRRDDHEWMIEEFPIRPERIPDWIPSG
jgi:hypothetical protein